MILQSSLRVDLQRGDKRHRNRVVNKFPRSEVSLGTVWAQSRRMN